MFPAVEIYTGIKQMLCTKVTECWRLQSYSLYTKNFRDGSYHSSIIANISGRSYAITLSLLKSSSRIYFSGVTA